MSYSAEQEQELMSELWKETIADDPLAFVMFAFPWGQKNTPLENFSGPRSWQRDELIQIRDYISECKLNLSKGLDLPHMYQAATASGRGVGKSALVAWVILWFMSTRLGSTTIVTANTETQLKTRTWAELGKWHTLLINAHWFDRTALSLKPFPWFEMLLKEQLKIDTGYYYAQAQLWSEENPDAFAGVHNYNGVLLIMDESSGIAKPIWDVSEGFFTEPVMNRFWLTYSNPRRNSGEFFECFHEHKKYWRTRSLDSREVEGTDKAKLNQIAEKCGEESDETKVEVRGIFPSQGDKQFISRELVEEAQMREFPEGEIEENYEPLIMGVDPARFGTNKSTIKFRQGRDAKTFPTIVKAKMDNMQLADECATLINRFNPDAVCIDAGNGSGVIDRLRQLGYKVFEIWFGASANKKERFADKRTEMWADMREWLKGGMLERGDDIRRQLTGPEFKYVGRGDAQKLESKEDMRARGLASPDEADALALTFAVKVSSRRLATSRKSRMQEQRMAKDVDYDVFGE